jgi:hypothetical protein
VSQWWIDDSERSARNHRLQQIARLPIEHRTQKGGSKARLLLGMGYSPDNCAALERDLLQQHLTMDAVCVESNDYGTSYEIVAPLVGPSGKTVQFRSVWQIELGTDVPRLITMVPELPYAI